MEVYITKAGKLTCEPPGKRTTVADLISTVLRFCEKHIDCSQCTNTCCAGLTVYADNVFVQGLLTTSRRSLADDDITDFLLRVLQPDQTQQWTVLKNQNGRCKFLSNQGHCLIYEIRPLVCRLYTCVKCTPYFQEIKDTLYRAYHEALQAEMSYSLPPYVAASSETPNCFNPVVGMNTYDAKIVDILQWGKMKPSNSGGT